MSIGIVFPFLTLQIESDRYTGQTYVSLTNYLIIDKPPASQPGGITIRLYRCEASGLSGHSYSRAAYS
jgi:hypothetical protein